MVARIDQVTDPRIQADLRLARRGTAYFSRKLAELPESELNGDSLLPGWTRRHVVAHVGYSARALTRLVEGVRTGSAGQMYVSRADRDEEISFGATLPSNALQNLHAHAAVHLDVEWRDLPDDHWQRPVTTATGRRVPVAETVWMRTRLIWVHAVDLDNGGSFDDLPNEVLDRLLADVLTTWSDHQDASPGFNLLPSDRETKYSAGTGQGPSLTGTMAEITRWALGRGGDAVLTTASSQCTPDLARWL